MTDPDPAHMLHYCSTVVPDMLTTVCGVDVDLAHRIGCDILDRAEAFAALTASDQRVLIVPFLEEAAHHRRWTLRWTAGRRSPLSCGTACSNKPTTTAC
ncbi:hypothetical protein [Actinoplanes derwentensis]|uniref:Uncharacterized protein n=1 Tax=Actinoplanes derwentensis TaxID=113562 RepID=A0A1H1XNS1_9ACTN|nr:hypothetical protein [Actinoplanes derwentensis]GID87708.1 hypothetical protein Ade03nite_66320 [Actinoplanes derwentensis]SDT10812.1 hypothetical protein SAMN04489716_2529 [Actinoplanes derwentensis]